MSRKKEQQKMDIDRKNLVSKPYYKLLSDYDNAARMKDLLLKPKIYALPHGRGAGASVAASVLVAYGMEVESEYRGKIHEKMSNGNLYQSQNTQDRTKVVDALFIVPEEDYAMTALQTFVFALDKMGLLSKWTLVTRSHEDMMLERNDSANRVLFVSETELFKKEFDGHAFKYIVFSDAHKYKDFNCIDTAIQRFLEPSMFLCNTVAVIDYHVPTSSSHWLNQNITRQKHTAFFKKFPATYLSMRREWLGEGFFKNANHIKRKNPIAYQNEYLGWQVDP